MSLLNKLCRELNIEIGEPWAGTDGNIYRLTEDGVLERLIDSGCSLIYMPDSMGQLLTEKLKVKSKYIEPKKGTLVYLANPIDKDLYNTLEWEGSEENHLLLKKNLIFYSAEEAIECSKSMLLEV